MGPVSMKPIISDRQKKLNKSPTLYLPPMAKLLIIITVMFIILIGYGFFEAFWIQIKVTKITDADVPPSFKNTRIVFITDIHYKENFAREQIRKVVEKVNSLNPDIILLGGDYVSYSQDHIKPCFEELARLKASIGKYGVLGNHDHRENERLTKECMRKAGIVCLDNDSLWIYKNKDRIKIGGVGDYWEDLTIIQNTIHDVDESDFVIVLSHNPDFAETLKTNKVDLVLSGHTHGGQITFFGLWSPFVPSQYGQKYRTGLVKTEHTQVLISNGVGFASNYPIRFFARPQINVIEL